MSAMGGKRTLRLKQKKRADDQTADNDKYESSYRSGFARSARSGTSYKVKYVHPALNLLCSNASGQLRLQPRGSPNLTWRR